MKKHVQQKHIQIRKGIKHNGNSHPDDVLQTKRHLKSLGYYKEPKYGITPYPDAHLVKAIKRFQKDNRLTVDGNILPDSKTEHFLNKHIDGQKVAARSPTYWCEECDGPHGGSKSPIICETCLKRKENEAKFKKEEMDIEED